MNKILIFSESRYRVDRKIIRKTVEKLLNEAEIKSPVEVSIAIVGNRKMRELAKKFKKEEKLLEVLSFSIMEGEPSVMPPDGILRLGDVIISYPQVIENAAKKDILVAEELSELLEHGLKNLLNVGNND